MDLLEKLSALVDKIKSDEVQESVIKERMDEMLSELQKEKEEQKVSEESKQEEQAPEQEVAVEEEVSEEVAAPVQEEPPEGFVPDMVEIPNHEITEVIEVRQKIARLHSLVGQMVEDFERRRQSALSALQAAQNELEEKVIFLRDSHSIPADLHYTIVFPKEPGASGAFVRADD